MGKIGKWNRWIILSFVIFLSGCFGVESPGDLIESPKPQEEMIELMDTLDKLLPSNREFMTPKKSEKKQSIILEDIDGDRKQEALILYSSLDDIDRKVHLLVLQESKEGWSEVSNIETIYQTVEYFGIHDLDDNGVKEIVVGFGKSEFETEKQLVIYEWDQGGLMAIIDREYEGIDISDYDGDKKKDVLLIEGERREAYTALLFSYKNGTLIPRSEVRLDPLSFHENMVSGNLNDGNQAFFIDSGIGAHSMITEIIAYSDDKLVRVDSLNGGTEIKAYPLYSKDINNDGVIEVGGMYIPEGWENAAFADIPFIDVYSSFSIDGNSKKVQERFTDKLRRYYIEIPSDWQGKVTIKKMENGVQLQSVSNEQVVFEVKWSSNKDSIDSNQTVLKETKDTIFYTELEEEKSFPFEMFHLLEDEF